MNLLANQLSLASMELKSERTIESLKRLKDTQEAYTSSSIVQNNLAVVQYLVNPESNEKQSQEIKTQEKQYSLTTTIASFEQSIDLNPLNYIPYYNLFSLYAKQKHFKEAYYRLIEAISALKLEKSLKTSSETLANEVQSTYCSQSILPYIIKAILYVKNQKYVLAVGSLLTAKNMFAQGPKVKLQILHMLHLLYRSLQQKDKQANIQKEISQIKQILNSTPQDQKQPHCSEFRLVYTRSLPFSDDQLKSQFALRIPEFSQLLKEKQQNSFMTIPKTPQVLFKQINSTDLLKSPTNIFTLLRTLKNTIQESAIFIEGESRIQSNSKASVFHSINHSNELTSTAGKMQSPQPKTMNSPDKRLSMTEITPSKNEGAKKATGLNQSESKQQNNSLNTSDINSPNGKTKRTPNVYPLYKPNQQVSVRLFSADLTNNKELVGNMDPYVVLTYNGKKVTSTVITGGGLTPKWKETFVFPLTSKPSSMKVEVYDKEAFFKKDDFVGMGTFTVEKNGLNPVPIFEGNVSAGRVLITIDSMLL